MRADGGALFQHADIDVGLELFEADGAGQACRTCPDNHGIVFEYISGHAAIVAGLLGLHANRAIQTDGGAVEHRVGDDAGSQRRELRGLSEAGWKGNLFAQ